METAIDMPDRTFVEVAEVWVPEGDKLVLSKGSYGDRGAFGETSRSISFVRGQGLVGGVWAAGTPILMRDLESRSRFVRAESAGQAGLTSGIGIPVSVPGGQEHVLTPLSARDALLVWRFEIWDARAAKVGATKTARLVDGLCSREGPLWDPENAGRERRVSAWQGPIGHVLGRALPVTESGAAAAGYGAMVALPIHRAGELAHVVAWYF